MAPKRKWIAPRKARLPARGSAQVLAERRACLQGSARLRSPLGPVVAAGWLAPTTLGVMAGAATGTIVGALTEAGVSEEEAPLYAEGVRRGGTLVSARVPEAERARFESILDQSAVNIRERSAAWQRSGWETFDASAQPYTADDVRKERELP